MMYQMDSLDVSTVWPVMPWDMVDMAQPENHKCFVVVRSEYS